MPERDCGFESHLRHPFPVISDEWRVMSETVAEIPDSALSTQHSALRVVLLVNPAALGVRRWSLGQVEEQLRARGAIVETAPTARAGDGVVIARQAAAAG